MLLVWIIAGKSRIVLVIDTARSFRTGEVVGAHALRDDDGRGGGGGIGNGVAADLAGHVEILEISARCGDFFEPAHGQQVVGRPGIDRNNRAQIRRLYTDDERIQITLRVIAGAAGNVAGVFVTCGRGQPGAHGGQRVDRRGGIALDHVNEGFGRIPYGKVVNQQRAVTWIPRVFDF